MKKIYFLTGSQMLYGKETLKQVGNDSKQIVEFLASKIKNVNFVWTETIKSADEVTNLVKQINADSECIGVIAWMHTFSPSKMWIRGFNLLQKPYLHLHTQKNKALPYGSIDQDFMNLNQSAHGDREHGFICSRMDIKRKVVVGYYQDEDVIRQISSWIDVVKAYDYSLNLNAIRFGDNMREVAVTEGDKVEAQIKLGWSVNTYPVGDLVETINTITDKEVDSKYEKIIKKYNVNTNDTDSIKEQVKYYLAMKKMFKKLNVSAFSNTFEDLHGLNQLPGLATQMLMDEGIGYSAEGDWKTACLDAVIMKLAENRKGNTGFIEDYTYDFENDLVLGAHMLEVSPRFAKSKPSIEVHPLGIGGKNPPARLVFDGVTGDAISLSLVDMGNRFRLIVAKMELVKQPKEMPNLPVARIMWKLKPSLKQGAKAWIMAGGAHHTVVTNEVTVEEVKDLARLFDIECVVIDENFDEYTFEKELMLQDIMYKLK